MSRETARPLWFFFIVLSLISFILNWVWEMAQMGAYTEMASAPWASTVLRFEMEGDHFFWMG